MPRIAFYTRISTDEDHQKYSLPAQKERLEAFAKAQHGGDWELFKVYRDMDSGTHMNRSGLEEMLRDAEARSFDTLLVFRVDRLSRKVRELAQMVDHLTQHGVTLRSITEPFDTSNAAGKMMLQMLGVFAEFEHSTICERTKVGMQKKVKGGEWAGGLVPYGYRLDPDSGLAVQEEEAVVVGKMFKMYVSAKEGAHTICRNLNDAGCRKRNGRKWDRVAILRVVKNPLYIGKLRWGEDTHNGNHSPIISPVVFDKAQEIRRSRTKDLNGRRWHNGSERLLSGTIRCARCKSAMVGMSTEKRGKKFPYYVCTTRKNVQDCDQDYVRADLLEKVIIQDIKEMFRDERLMLRIWEEVNRRLSAERPDVDKELGRAETEIGKVRTRLDRYFSAFEEGTMKPELCNEKVGELQGRLGELEAEKRGLEEKRRRLDLPALDPEMLSALLENFEDVLASGTNPQKKDLLQRLVKKVLVHSREKVEVWYALPRRPVVSTPDRSGRRDELEQPTTNLTKRLQGLGRLDRFWWGKMGLL